MIQTHVLWFCYRDRFTIKARKNFNAVSGSSSAVPVTPTEGKEMYYSLWEECALYRLCGDRGSYREIASNIAVQFMWFFNTVNCRLVSVTNVCYSHRL